MNKWKSREKKCELTKQLKGLKTVIPGKQKYYKFVMKK